MKKFCCFMLCVLLLAVCTACQNAGTQSDILQPPMQNLHWGMTYDEVNEAFGGVFASDGVATCTYRTNLFGLPTPQEGTVLAFGFSSKDLTCKGETLPSVLTSVSFTVPADSLDALLQGLEVHYGTKPVEQEIYNPDFSSGSSRVTRYIVSSTLRVQDYDQQRYPYVQAINKKLLTDSTGDIEPVFANGTAAQVQDDDPFYPTVTVTCTEQKNGQTINTTVGVLIESNLYAFDAIAGLLVQK